MTATSAARSRRVSPKRRWYKGRRSRLPQRVALLMVLGGLALVASQAHQLWRSVETYPARALSERERKVEIDIPRGTALPGILRILVRAEILKDEDSMYFKVFVLQRGAANRMTAGPHLVSTSMTPIELLEELVRAPGSPEVRVTIPEGWNMAQVAKELSTAGFGSEEAIVAKMRDRSFLKSMEVEGRSLEGYLFPDTYRFDRKAGLEKALTRMVRRHREVFNDLYRRYRASAIKNQKSLGWGPRDLVTLASIVEKETGASRERPRIAGVFYNRLRFASFRPKLLQTDPTIMYGCTVPIPKSKACQSFVGRIRRVHLRDRENIYNTYKHEGLPPGPIANPGKAALEAVMDPERHKFLYFVSRNDGTHAFSKTREEHEGYVDKYQR